MSVTVVNNDFEQWVDSYPELYSLGINTLDAIYNVENPRYRNWFLGRVYNVLNSYPGDITLSRINQENITKTLVSVRDEALVEIEFYQWVKGKSKIAQKFINPSESFKYNLMLSVSFGASIFLIIGASIASTSYFGLFLFIPVFILSMGFIFFGVNIASEQPKSKFKKKARENLRAQQISLANNKK